MFVVLLACLQPMRKKREEGKGQKKITRQLATFQTVSTQWFLYLLGWNWFTSPPLSGEMSIFTSSKQKCGSVIKKWGERIFFRQLVVSSIWVTKYFNSGYLWNYGWGLYLYLFVLSELFSPPFFFLIGKKHKETIY